MTSNPSSIITSFITILTIFVFSSLASYSPTPRCQERPSGWQKRPYSNCSSNFCLLSCQIGLHKVWQNDVLDYGQLFKPLSQHLYLRKMLILWGRMGDISEIIHTKHLGQCLTHLRDICCWETDTHTHTGKRNSKLELISKYLTYINM